MIDLCKKSNPSPRILVGEIEIQVPFNQERSFQAEVMEVDS